jgi:hypothetical protein
MNNSEIQQFVSAITILENIQEERRSSAYSDLLLQTKCILHHNCDHCLDNDVGENLTICKTCGLTVDIQFCYDYFTEMLKSAKQQYWSIVISSHVCPLRDFTIQNNKIVFSIVKEGNERSTISVYLKELVHSRVQRGIVFI